MSATTIHSNDTTTEITNSAQFLAPGTHQRADAKEKGTGKGKGQGEPKVKTFAKGRAT